MEIDTCATQRFFVKSRRRHQQDFFRELAVALAEMGLRILKQASAWNTDVVVIGVRFASAGCVRDVALGAAYLLLDDLLSRLSFLDPPKWRYVVLHADPIAVPLPVPDDITESCVRVGTMANEVLHHLMTAKTAEVLLTGTEDAKTSKEALRLIAISFLSVLIDALPWRHASAMRALAHDVADVITETKETSPLDFLVPPLCAFCSYNDVSLLLEDVSATTAMGSIEVYARVFHRIVFWRSYPTRAMQVTIKVYGLLFETYG
jgi:hypothetical protein